jgi:hypothetical protein
MRKLRSREEAVGDAAHTAGFEAGGGATGWRMRVAFGSWGR